MGFKYVAPAVTQDEINEAVQASGPRQLAKKGSYKVRLHSMKGREYVKDGETRDLSAIFFINLDGNYKGAELTLFRIGGNSATTTNGRAVAAILTAAGLNAEQISGINWALDTDSDADNRGNVSAAFVAPDGSTISVEGLEFQAMVDIDVNKDTGYSKNVITALRSL